MENIEVYATAVGTIAIVTGVMVATMRECSRKVGVIFKRFDDYKDHLERTHVSKEVHDIKYQQLEKTLDEIRLDVKTLIRKANGG